jgi:hypothetical protein
VYLLVQHPNEHGESTRTTIGPFFEREALMFARALRFARNPRTFLIRSSDTPVNFVTIVHPNDLFPWDVQQLPIPETPPCPPPDPSPPPPD